VPWLDAAPPSAPTIAVASTTAHITPGPGEEARWWAVRVHSTTGWTSRILFGTERTLTIDTNVDRLLLQAVDQAGNFSQAAEWRRQ
jgi:hypothetical protein